MDLSLSGSVCTLLVAFLVTLLHACGSALKFELMLLLSIILGPGTVASLRLSQCTSDCPSADGSGSAGVLGGSGVGDPRYPKACGDGHPADPPAVSTPANANSDLFSFSRILRAWGRALQRTTDRPRRNRHTVQFCPLTSFPSGVWLPSFSSASQAHSCRTFLEYSALPISIPAAHFLFFLSLSRCLSGTE